MKGGIFCVSQDWEGGMRGLTLFLKRHPVQKGASLKFGSKVRGAQGRQPCLGNSGLLQGGGGRRRKECRVFGFF